MQKENNVVEHTPLPWRRQTEGEGYAPGIVRTDDVPCIADCGWYLPGDNDAMEIVDANMDFIVRACNSHDELVNQLEALWGWCLNNHADELFAGADFMRAAVETVLEKAKGDNHAAEA